MAKHYNNSVSQYALIVYLGIALLLGQTFKLHMHIQHDGIPSSTNAGHIIDVHVAFSPHDTTYHTHHQDNVQGHYHPAEIGISSIGFVKKAGLLNSFVLLFFIISIFLCVPRLRRIHRKRYSKTERPLRYYLLQPPLRAPPFNTL